MRVMKHGAGDGFRLASVTVAGMIDLHFKRGSYGGNSTEIR